MSDIEFIPAEIMGLIASNLSSSDFARFKLTCHLFNNIGNQAQFLQPFYNRLHALDSNLPVLLSSENSTQAFYQAFNTIRNAQSKEIEIFKTYHLSLLTEEEKEVLTNNDTPITIETLEQRDAILNKINVQLIQPIIDKNPDSTELWVGGLKITRFPISLLQQENNPDYWHNLTSLVCVNTFVTMLNIQNCSSLVSLFCHNPSLTVLKLTECPQLEILDCSNSGLQFLNIQDFEKLTRVSCQGNALVSCIIKNTPALTKLELHRNNITDLTIVDSPNLVTFQCHNNQLTETLDCSQFPALEEFQCHENNLSTLILGGCSKLKRLSCDKNFNLTKLDLQNCTSLNRAYIDPEHLTDLNLTNVPEAFKNKYPKLEQKFHEICQNNASAAQAILEIKIIEEMEEEEITNTCTTTTTTAESSLTTTTTTTTTSTAEEIENIEVEPSYSSYLGFAYTAANTISNVVSSFFLKRTRDERDGNTEDSELPANKRHKL